MQLRDKMRERPFDDPTIKTIIQKCGTPHHLNKGDELVRQSCLLFFFFFFLFSKARCKSTAAALVKMHVRLGQGA